MILRRVDGNKVAFRCPGCEETHVLPVSGERAWYWNGSMESPTFAPSILARHGHYVPGHESEPCWCTYNAAHPDDPDKFGCGICHSYVTEGRIQFLGDCTHKLAGQTVPIPEWDTEK